MIESYLENINWDLEQIDTYQWDCWGFLVWAAYHYPCNFSDCFWKTCWVFKRGLQKVWGSKFFGSKVLKFNCKCRDVLLYIGYCSSNKCLLDNHLGHPNYWHFKVLQLICECSCCDSFFFQRDNACGRMTHNLFTKVVLSSSWNLHSNGQFFQMKEKIFTQLDSENFQKFWSHTEKRV